MQNYHFPVNKFCLSATMFDQEMVVSVWCIDSIMIPARPFKYNLWISFRCSVFKFFKIRMLCFWNDCWTSLQTQVSRLLKQSCKKCLHLKITKTLCVIHWSDPLYHVGLISAPRSLIAQILPTGQNSFNPQMQNLTNQCIDTSCYCAIPTVQSLCSSRSSLVSFWFRDFA